MHLPKNILIFGIAGEYGTFWKDFLELRGYDVRGIEKDDLLGKRRDLVSWAQVVIFSVTNSSTVKVIGEVLPFSKKAQLWINTASIQTPGIEALKKSSAEYASFRVLGSVPKEETLKDRKIAICSEDKVVAFKDWFAFILNHTKATLVRVESEKLDEYTQVVTQLNRQALLVQAIAIASFGLDSREFDSLGTTLFEDQFATVARFLLQNDDLDVALLGDEQAMVSLEHLLQASHYLQCALVEKGGDEIKKIKGYLREFFSETVLKRAVEKKYGKK